MTVTTRLALLTLTVGFIIEGAGEAYEFIQHAYLGGTLVYFYYLGPASTILGFLFAFVGRHEWSELHRRHVLHAHRVLALAIVLLVLVVASVLALALTGSTSTAPAIAWTLGGLTAFGLASSFVSYLLIAYHLTSARGKALLAAALGWAIFISALTGAALAEGLGNITSALRSDPLSLAKALNNLTLLTTVLFVSYFLLTIAYHDAYRQVQRGVLPAGHAPAKRLGRSPGSPPSRPAHPAPPGPPPPSR